MRTEIAEAAMADLGWPAEELLDSEEQDEPLAGQDHRDTIDSLYYPVRGQLAGPTCFVAAELRVRRNPANRRDYREPDILVALGVADRVREYYDLWLEPKAPDLVIEVFSKSSVEHVVPAPDETLWSVLIPFGWRVVDNWVHTVDGATGFVFPPPWELEPQLQAEIDMRQRAQEQARLAQEQARLANERASRAEEELARLRRQLEERA